MKKFFLSFIALTNILFAVPEDQVITLSKETAEFSFSFYSTLDHSSNFVFSPYSIFSSLSMLYVGSKEETSQEIQKALFTNFLQNKISPIFSQLQHNLIPNTKIIDGYALDIANGLWVDQDTYVLSDFLHAAEEDFDAKVQDLDFHEAEKAITLMNEWISNQTRGKIPSLIQPGDITGATRMVVTNALYFKGNWMAPFSPKSTSPGPFYLSSKNSINVPMMQQTYSFPYFENDLFQLIALPFIGKSRQNNTLAFLIYLPKLDIDVATVEQNLNAIQLQTTLNQLKTELVDVKIPRFALKMRFDLNATLQEMGIKSAFSDDANFSGIDGMCDLFLSKVVHESFLSLDEAGVTAAAATAASLNVTSVLEKKPPISFIADHPFLFFIVDMKYKTPIFMGKLSNPQ
jgi:serpin B